jgi:broad specificity phosphatase PhoE
MTRLLLVRHAEPAASWQQHDDPGLSSLGRQQAAELASTLPDAARRRIVSSPLARAAETAAVLAPRGLRPRLEPGVGEVPTPRGRRADRARWLREAFGRRWPDLDEDLQRWRGRVVETLTAMTTPATVVTHFVAINVAVGEATGDDRVWCCSPAHCSVTEVDVGSGNLELVRLGDETASRVT